MYVYLNINQGIRTGIVLATLDGVCLVEYEMPNGTTALVYCDEMAVKMNKQLHFLEYRNVSYKRLTQKWLLELALQNVMWQGTPQRSDGIKMRSPEEMLSKRSLNKLAELRDLIDCAIENINV